ncbi:hypothetical protein OG453_08145 [Streptomyces sp. NBC_01381]|uniref:hypothetical protein n=1 Tax=Streptomyces sp. NBC_01381 TaxID=2903845 RepID=UPI00225375A8|nr:hypothetical protein [Streptomyces sp. NBC_01381]MCX4666639.1 hypothetical protein [Streptomyces sp. NBC_01381]
MARQNGARSGIELNWTLRTELDLPCPGDGSAYRELAEPWFTAALTALAGPLQAEFTPDADFSGRAVALSRGEAAPGELWATLVVLEPAKRRQKPYEVPWSPKNWSAFLRDLESMPGQATVVLRAIGSDGHPDWPWLDVSVVRDRDTPEVVSLVASRTTEEFADPGVRSEAQARWIDFFRTQVHRHEDILYGSIADDAEGVTGRTALEVDLGLLLEDTFPGLGTVLRGYAWWTVCSPGVVSALGGVEALRASGAFHEVEPLPGGGASLRATQNVWDYGEERVRAVFRILAPALPEGKPVKGFSSDTPRLVYEDAADYRGVSRC